VAVDGLGTRVRPLFGAQPGPQVVQLARRCCACPVRGVLRYRLVWLAMVRGAASSSWIGFSFLTRPRARGFCVFAWPPWSVKPLATAATAAKAKGRVSGGSAWCLPWVSAGSRHLKVHARPKSRTLAVSDRPNRLQLGLFTAKDRVESL
jgi:hypothetical protein